MKDRIISMIVCLMVLVLLSGCDSILSSDEETMKDFYNKEDFQSITIGVSTFQDVNEVAFTESMQITSYGGFCDYPVKDGGYIRIKFHGKELIVGSIEEFSALSETD